EVATGRRMNGRDGLMDIPSCFALRCELAWGGPARRSWAAPPLTAAFATAATATATLGHALPALQCGRVAAVERFEETLAALELFGVVLGRVKHALALLGGGELGGRGGRGCGRC